MKLADKIGAASRHPLTPRKRFLAKALPVFVYAFFFPALLFVILKFYLDPWLGFQTFLNPAARILLGGLLIVPGMIFLLWPTQAKATRIIAKGMFPQKGSPPWFP